MNLWLGFLLTLSLFGCARVGAPPPVAPPVPPPPAAPHFEKTFGSIQPLPNGGLAIQYKKIALLLDPPVAQPEVDYVLLTGADSRRWNSSVQVGLRKNVKILASSADAPIIQKQGFTQVKASGPGQRLLLKKEDGFLFVSATAGQGYFLEFDNGKNIFVAGDVSNPDALREFVYALRDDGREIEIGFFQIGPGTDMAALASTIGLLQPKNAVLLREPGAKTLDLPALHEHLKTEFFENPIVVAGNDPVVF
jgi:hypothetical protein